MKRSLYELLKADPKAVERFRSYVDQRGRSECWAWLRFGDRDGYGRFAVGGSVSRCNRIAWVLANDRDVPRGKVVMHSCDNPRCCNPAHLSVGTHSDNARDRVLKGRSGSLDPIVRAKMSEAQRKRWSDSALRAKQSEAQRKRWSDPVERAKRSEGQRKRCFDPAVRVKMSERARKRWSDPAVRRKMSEVQRKRWSDPALRAKLSEAQRERREREWMLKFYGA